MVNPLSSRGLRRIAEQGMRSTGPRDSRGLLGLQDSAELVRFGYTSVGPERASPLDTPESYSEDDEVKTRAK